MKINYKKAILRFFLIMSAMFVVVVTTSALRECSNDWGIPITPYLPADGGQPMVMETCDTTEGYKIGFAKPEFEKAFVVGGKGGDLDRNIEVKFDELTRANGFGAAMPEFKSLYKTIDAANADKGAKVKENDGVIGFWGSYFVKNAARGPVEVTGPIHAANSGLSLFILGLDVEEQEGSDNGSGDSEQYWFKRGVRKYSGDALGFKKDSYVMPLTSGPAWLPGVAGNDFVDYKGETVAGGAFTAEKARGADGVSGWTYDSIGRLENLPGVVDSNDERIARGVVFGTTVDWELSAANKGHTDSDTYDPAKGWQHLFSIRPCDDTVKNGLIVAQVTKKGAAAEIVDAAEKMHLRGGPADNKVRVRMSDVAGAAKREIFVDSFIGEGASSFGAAGFATMNYNLRAGFGGPYIGAGKFHTVTQLSLMCRTSITGVSEDQAALFADPAAAGDLKADSFTDGAKNLDCYLGISNLYPKWYEGVVAVDVLDSGYKNIALGKAAYTLDEMFKDEVAVADRKEVLKYDTRTKKVGLVIADTGDVKLDSDESKALFYAPVGDDKAQAPKWKAFIEQDGVKTIKGTLTFKFIRPDIK